MCLKSLSFFFFILQSFQPSQVNTSAVPVQLRPRLSGQAEDRPRPAPPHPAPLPPFLTGATMAAGGVHHLSLPLLLPVSSLLLSLLLTGSHALREYQTATAPPGNICLQDSIHFRISCLPLNSEEMEDISGLLSHPINSCSGFVRHHLPVKMSLEQL